MLEMTKIINLSNNCLKLSYFFEKLGFSLIELQCKADSYRFYLLKLLYVKKSTNVFYKTKIISFFLQIIVPIAYRKHNNLTLRNELIKNYSNLAKSVCINKGCQL